MSQFRPLLALSVLLLGAGACKKSPTDSGDREVTVTKFTCDQSGGGQVGCDITIPPSASKLRITLVSHDCLAVGDIISVSEPKVITLTTDACYETVPKSIEIVGPFSAARLSMKVTSKFIANPPELRLTGASPLWTIYFEDGGDQDFNDAVLTVEAI